MAVKESLRLLVLLLFAIKWLHVESKILSKEVPGVNNKAAPREKRFSVDLALSAIGLAVSVASAIQGAVCTFSGACGGDEVSQALERMEKKAGCYTE